MKQYGCFLIVFACIAYFGYYFGAKRLVYRSHLQKPPDINRRSRLPNVDTGTETGKSIEHATDGHSLELGVTDPFDDGRNWEQAPIEDKKVILVAWDGFSEMYSNYRAELTQVCPMCHFTEDLAYLNRSQAVIFHGEFYPKRLRKLRVRSDQIWIWRYTESPATVKMGSIHNKYKYMFNWTMTYRRDSDIFLPYGRFLPKEKPAAMSRLEDKWAYKAIENERKRDLGVFNGSMMPVPTVDELRGRKMAAWIVSKCDVNSKRHVVAEALSKNGINVDVYGPCGPFKCPNSRANWNTGIDCRTAIAHKYKFYLAFENSLCEDYVTEKLFRTLHTQMVPIVYGGADYAQFAPPHSYIDIMDFQNARALADYLVYLDKNPAEYLKYFEWRNQFWVENIKFVPEFCSICERVWKMSTLSQNKGNDTVIATNTMHDDLIGWWNRRSDYKVSGKMACESSAAVNEFINAFIS